MMRNATSFGPAAALALVVAAGLVASAPVAGAGQQIPPDEYSVLRYRFIGPEGNRTIAVVGEPGNPLSIYVGAASGGLWRTRDGGVNWAPVFDDQTASSVSGWRPLRTWDLDLNQGQLGPRVVPGDYEVVLGLGDAVRSVTQTVLKDPHSEGTLADIREQVAMSIVIRDEINEVVEMIDRIEWSRSQLENLAEMVADDTTAAELLAEARALEETAIGVESRLFDIYLTGAREDAFRNPIKLYGRLSALAQDVGWSSADFPPTVPQTEVHQVLQERLEDARILFRQLFADDAEKLNQLLRERRLPVVIS